ncbi:MAG: magnesium and cobalt transport protein CorA [Clostridiales bacterium]|jgi:magnesium transporter|nr:magnesium and cobalt transport protein CorA [Clostridiales bacterium]
MIKNILYENGKIVENSSIKSIKSALISGEKIWVDMERPDEKEMNLLRDVFKFHPLAIEDCVHRIQRPKVVNYKDYYFIVLNEFIGGDINKYFTYSEVYIFLGDNYIVTLHWNKLKVIGDTMERITNGPYIFEKGIDFILYNLFDTLVDDYFPLTDSIGDKIDDIEETILKEPKRQVQDDILVLKRNILKLRKVLSPQREVLNILLRHDFDLIQEENRLYYMDVYDHMLRIYDLLDTYTDLLASTMDLYMSQISNRMNEVMKVLTMITTIMMPLSLIAGIYGMNFKFMPELGTRYGYFATLGLMAVIAVMEIFYFKKKKWF